MEKKPFFFLDLTGFHFFFVPYFSLLFSDIFFFGSIIEKKCQTPTYILCIEDAQDIVDSKKRKENYIR